MDVVVEIGPHDAGGLLDGKKVNPGGRDDVGGIQPVQQSQHVLHFVQQPSRTVVIAGFASVLCEDVSRWTDGAVATRDARQAVAGSRDVVAAVTLRPIRVTLASLAAASVYQRIAKKPIGTPLTTPSSVTFLAVSADVVWSMGLACATETVCGQGTGTGQAGASRRGSKETLRTALTVVAHSVATAVDADAGLLVTEVCAVVAIAGLSPTNQIQDVSTVEVVRLELAVVAISWVLAGSSGVLDWAPSLLDTVGQVGSHFVVVERLGDLERYIFQAEKPGIRAVIGSDEDFLDILQGNHQHAPSHGNLWVVHLVPSILMDRDVVEAIGGELSWLETQEDAMVSLQEYQRILAQHGFREHVTGIAVHPECQLSVVREHLVSEKLFRQRPVEWLV